MKNRYAVHGHTNIEVVIEVLANSEKEAMEKAYEQRDDLTTYCGNGGTDKLVGVDCDNESVYVDSDIEYDDVEFLGISDDDEEEE